jgi:uncharacterized phage-associated protein
MKTYDSTLLARYLVSFAYNKKLPLNVTKLQKLLYIIYGFYLAEHGHLIVNESPKIWPFGPVFPRVHKEVDATQILDLDDAQFEPINADLKLIEVLHAIVDKYAKFSATQLSNWSHMAGSPWDKTVKDSGSQWNTVIPDEYITRYFSGINTI